MADVNLACPAGGKWYACPSNSSSKFVGCCETDADPCATGCAAGALQPATYNGTYYGKFPDATCGSTSQFLTCGLDPEGKNNFWGCCKSNACQNGGVCPTGSLTSAYMELPEQFAFYASSTLPSGTPSSSNVSVSGDSRSNGAVIGGAVGGGIGAILIIALIAFLLWRKRRNAKTARGDNVEVATPMMKESKAFDSHPPNFAAQSPPPTYAAADGEYYQGMVSQGKVNPHAQSPYAQGHWAHTSDGPQEMEAEVGPSNRYSELPAEALRPDTHYRYSELSTGPSCRVSPQHSPNVSQNDTNVEPTAKGLGVVIEAPTRPLGLSRD